MAIYIRTIGFREIESIENECDRISKILDSIVLDLDFLNENLIDKELLKWELVKTKYHSYFELKLEQDSLKVFFDNPNFIEFLGSKGWDIRDFGVGEDNRKYLNGAKEIFKSISRNYGISELYYFSEWFFDPDSIREGENSVDDLKKLLESNPYSAMPDFWEEWPNGYVVEKQIQF
ncbi:hypothetical protein [Flagellimonas lutimaris]|uniref:hypothetical protein n=1 Tax=Flagellimonas lutimaris TaxID=475082 RepID=UPI003F5CCBD9